MQSIVTGSGFSLSHGDGRTRAFCNTILMHTTRSLVNDMAVNDRMLSFPPQIHIDIYKRSFRFVTTQNKALSFPSGSCLTVLETQVYVIYITLYVCKPFNSTFSQCSLVAVFNQIEGHMWDVVSISPFNLVLKKGPNKSGEQNDWQRLCSRWKTKDRDHYWDIAWLEKRGHKKCQVWNQIIREDVRGFKCLKKNISAYCVFASFAPHKCILFSFELNNRLQGTYHTVFTPSFSCWSRLVV